jgi:hypothetical protein
MIKKTSTKKWKYLIVMLLGIVVFATVIPSCTAISNSKLDVLVNKSTKEQKSTVYEGKSLASIIENLPSAKEIRAMPLAPHPRLLASEERFAEIKEQIKTDATMKEWYEKLHLDAEQFLEEEPPVYELENSIGMILISKLAIKRIEVLALVYRLSKDKRYLDRVWQELRAISEFPNWNPSHFLDTAEMTYAFAIGYDWLYQDWNQQQKELIRTNIVEKGLKPALDGYGQEKWWTEAKNNWNQVCNGGIGIGALSIMDSDPQISSEVLYKALNGLPIAMQHYAPDGAWNEGLSYWHYGTSYNVAILNALETSFGQDFDLSKIVGFAKTGFFPIYATGPFGYPFNFADGLNKRISYPELFWLSQKFEQPVFAEFQKQMSMAEPMDLIWNKSSAGNNYQKNLPLDRYFRNSEIVTMRSSWKESQALFIGFKAGDNKVSHSHLDLGSFVFDALGVRWAMDLGKDRYGLPGYFETEARRWTYYRTRAEGQNTIVVNPSKNAEQNPDAEAKIKRFSSKADRAFAVADLTPAYYPSVSRLMRKVALQNKRQQLLIEDEVQANSPIDLWWFMHTRAKIKIDQSRTSAVLSQNGVRLWMKILNPIDAHFSIMPAEPLTYSPNPKGQLENVGVKKLAIEIEQVKDATLSVLLVPLKDKQNLPKMLPNVIKKSEW